MDVRCAMLILGAAFGFASCGGSPNSPSLPPGISVPPAQISAASATWSCVAASHTGISSGISCSQRTRLSIDAISADLAPGAPTNLAATVNGSTVTFTWIAPVGADAPTSYVIEAGSVPGANNLANFDTGSAATTQVVTDVPTATYHVRVRAHNAAGLSAAPSNEVIVRVSTCSGPPPPPAGLGYAVRGSAVTVFWSLAPGTASYVLEVGSSAGLSNLTVFDTGSTAVSFTASGVAAGDYYVRVRAKNTCGLSPPSNEVVPRVCPIGMVSCPGPWRW